ncbi:MAG: UDP-N-acetylmuramoyl-L-alanyl-D-glutamate--2,6-diaminopimelate ligase [Nitrospirae bacterium]|nr:UDP-N-acetylmuramoyl-L-alanyl-D-glutamate--2,6-diaminopimelate ligase [Nitrospirota bacterium]
MKILKLEGNGALSVEGLAYSSRDVQEGFLFAAMSGVRTDGHLFVQEAIDRGASAILCEKLPELDEEKKSRVVSILVENSRRAFAQIASRFYGDPSFSMGIIGVTGTNGKTTTSFLIKKLLESKGKTGLTGTVGNWTGAGRREATHTTPESSDLQRLFFEMKGAGVQNVVMEVSSHALALERVVGTSFDTVIFTNLTRDHLDFHRSMEDYFHAKSRLFTEQVPMGSKKMKPRAIINLDDAYGERLTGISAREVWTYGMSPKADLQGRAVKLTDTGTSFQMIYPEGMLQIHSPLLGTFNVYNMLAAAGAALHQGITADVIEETFGQKIEVPGRLEKIQGEYPFTVLVDYAHTEDALVNVLRTIHEFKKKRIIIVFGCGGDRDKGKRPKMGSTAGRFADVVILTSDNPRSENPETILREIEEGVIASGAKKYRVLVNRRDAIKSAIEEAKQGDLVLIAGKGHETYQIIGSNRFEFNDLTVAKEMLSARFGY